MNNFLVTIIVPVYNVEKYIKKCLDSILSQRYLNYELILINDGSTDDSGKICDEYASKSSKIKVIHQENKGLSSARNKGISNAKGEYIWFIDSDDWIVENAFSIIVEELKTGMIEMLGFYEARFIEEENRIQEYYDLKKISLTNGNLYLRENRKFVPAACFYIYNLNFIEKNKLYFKENLIHEDDYFNLMCFSKVQKIKKINTVLYYYRIRNNSIISSKVTMQRLVSCLEIIKLCKTLRGSSLDMFFIDSRIRSYINMLFIYLKQFQDNHNTNDVYKIIRETKKILPKQKLYLNDKKGVFIDKIIYNFSGIIYFKYKKYN